MTHHQQYQVDTHQQDDTANQTWPLATTGSLSTHPTKTSAKTFSVGRVTNTLSEDKLAWRRQCNKESKRRSRARLKSPEKTADESAKRQQRRESSSPEKRAGDNAKRREEYAKKSPEKRAKDNAKRREKYAKKSPETRANANAKKREDYAKKSPEKRAGDNAKRREDYAKMSPEKRAQGNAKRREEYAKKSPEKRAQDNAKRREDYAKMSPDKKEALNDRKAELQRKKYYSPRLWEINEERRYKYLHMSRNECERVRKYTRERVWLHRARKMGPSVECADVKCKTLVPLSRDERFCGRHRGPIVARSGWDGKGFGTAYKNRQDEDSIISLQALIWKYGDLTQCADPDCKTNTNLGPYLTAGHKCVRCRVDERDTCNHGYPELVQMFDWGGFPKYCQVCQPGCIDIEYHHAQPIEYKCYNQAMYSSVIEPFVSMKDLGSFHFLLEPFISTIDLGSWVWVEQTLELPIDMQNCINTECLHYCFMGYCSSNCKKKDRHIQVLRSYDSKFGGRFKLLLQFRNRALEWYSKTTKPEDRDSNFVWRTQAKCDCCSSEFEVQDLISCDDKGHLVCKKCLQNHVQATFEHRRQAALIKDESFVQFKMEWSLAQSMQSPNDFDIECPNCGCIFRDQVLRDFLDLQLPVQAKKKEENESAAVSIQTAFRRFRIRWRYYHSKYGREKIDHIRSYIRKRNELLQREKAAVSIQTTFREWKIAKIQHLLFQNNNTFHDLLLNIKLKNNLERSTYDYYHPRHSNYLEWRDLVNGYTDEAISPPSNEMIRYFDSLFRGYWVSEERWDRENLAALSIQTAYRWWKGMNISDCLMRNKSFVKLKYHVSLKKWISHDLSAHTTKIMESHRRVERPQTSTCEMIKSTRPLLRLSNNVRGGQTLNWSNDPCSVCWDINKPAMRGLVSTFQRNKIEVRNLSLILLTIVVPMLLLLSTRLTLSLAANSNLQLQQDKHRLLILLIMYSVLHCDYQDCSQRCICVLVC